MKRILIVTPRSPFDGRGADEQDRLAGIEWWIQNGYEVSVITKVLPSDLPGVERAKEKYGIPIYPVLYKYSGKKSLGTILRRVFIPKYWDGAAFEYFDPEIQKVLEKELLKKPDLVWFDYTYLWPLYAKVKNAGIPIITRSINFEPNHFLDEDGKSFVNIIKYWTKLRSESKALILSDWFFAITPAEEVVYKKLGPVPVRTLPLRSLPKKLIKRAVAVHERVNIGFMPSKYSVAHNKAALIFIINEVWGSLPAEIKEKVTLHVTGSKFPIEVNLPPGIMYDGFVESSTDFWQSMDIALAPSIFGAGMQQKIFEPLTLGVPTITSKRGLADYPFICGQHVMCADTKEEFCFAIKAFVNDEEKRKTVSNLSQKLAFEIFSQEKFDNLVNEAIQNI